MARLAFTVHGEIIGVPEDMQLLAISLGQDGVLTSLWATPQDAEASRERTEVPGWASFPITHTDLPAPLLVHLWHQEWQSTVLLEPSDVAHAKIARFPETGELMLASSRCRVGEDGPEQNGHLVSREGRLLMRGVLGDGVEHLVVDADGYLWAGYHDEGIFGNFGWGARGPAPIGAPGVVCFDREMAIVWHPTVDERLGIFDVYTMTSRGAGVVLCPYNRFDVLEAARSSPVRVTAGGIGAIAIVASDSIAGLIAAPSSTKKSVAIHFGSGKTESLRVTLQRGVTWPHTIATCGPAAAFISGRLVLGGELKPNGR